MRDRGFNLWNLMPIITGALALAIADSRPGIALSMSGSFWKRGTRR